MIFEAQKNLLEGEAENDLKTKMCEEILRDDNMQAYTHVTVKPDEDCISLPDLELTEEFLIEDKSNNHNAENEVLSQTTSSPKQEPTVKKNEIMLNTSDTEQEDYTIYISHSSDSEKDQDSNDNQATPALKRTRKERSKRKDLDAVIAQWSPNLECVICKQYLPNFTTLAKHFHDIHPKERCHVQCCHRKFYLRCKLEEHARLHLNPEAFKCEMCDSCHFSRNALYLHLRSMHATQLNEDTAPPDSVEIAKHEKKKIDRRFKSKNNEILRCRSNVECAICKVVYGSFYVLKQHFRDEHPNEWCYTVCCDLTFYRGHAYEQHLLTHHHPNAQKDGKSPEP